MSSPTKIQNSKSPESALAATAEVQIFNTLSGKKEVFRPRKAGVVNIYGCGPTVYGFTHVGNAFAALAQDLVARVFRHAGYKVKLARNVTDVDDKIIKVANERGIDHDHVAQEFTEHYFSELKTLQVVPPDVVPHATHHIPEMVSMIEGLVAKGFAYPAATPFGNDVYFRVAKFKDYGKLSRRKLDEMTVGARIEPGEAKEDPLDFALWKASKEGEPKWPSPWGEGRPGWHIECSAMINKHFGDELDIHMGGLDLIFPHHENEIAQSEALSEKTLAPYWIHNNMLTLGREKMSKSLGNIFSTHDFLASYGPETLRLLLLQHHYRSPIDFTEESILRAEALLDRLYHCKALALQHAQALSHDGVAEPEDLARVGERVDQALFDDFNTAKAIGFILKAARLCFRGSDSGQQQPSWWAAWGRHCLKPLNEIYGLLSRDPVEALAENRARRLKRMGVTEDFSARVEARLKAREESRAQKNYAESDRLRQELEAEGILVMDGPDGSSWSLKSPTSPSTTK